jgi:hypothetical protein
MKKIAKHLIQDNWSPGRDSNRELPEYKAVLLDVRYKQLISKPHELYYPTSTPTALNSCSH